MSGTQWREKYYKMFSSAQYDNLSIYARGLLIILSVHTAAVVASLIEAAGARLVFLPPYSPDLSPVELCWSKLKPCLRAAKATTHEIFNQALTRIVNEQISSDDAWG